MKAKQLIVGNVQEGAYGAMYEPGAEDGPGSAPPRRPGGPPRRPMRDPEERSGPGGLPLEPQGLLSRAERNSLKDLVLLDLLHALGGDAFYAGLVKMAISGADPDAGQIQHFLDEAGKYAKTMSPEVNALMGKLSQLPK